MEPIIKVENIGKQYRLGNVGTGTLSHDLNRWWQTNIRGKEDPYLKIGETNDRTQSGGSDYVWALQDINFEVQPGEILGIIGKNGAGKSTLLKLLSRVTAPTTGKITSYGRIASLLEVGTGFHPELTGKENVYLNGAILGMTKKEIARKYDEIVDFAGCAKYMDTPVKRYSSGMRVRLGFAVAAFLEPDILVVDEVLAVGDAEFQKKAIGKMQDVSQGQGRTVLFVSHNMASIKNLCTRGVVLDKGWVNFIGTANDAISHYLQINQQKGFTGEYINDNIKESGFTLLSILDKNDKIRTEFGFHEKVKIKMKIKVDEKHINSNVGLRLADKNEKVIFVSQMQMNKIIKEKGVHTIEVLLPQGLIVPNHYKLSFGLHIPNVEIIDIQDEPLSFEIVETGTDFHMYQGQDIGCVIANCKWKTSE